MSVAVVCQQCGGSYRLQQRYAGHRVKCPNCKGPIDVPQVSDAPEAARAPQASAASRPTVSSAGNSPQTKAHAGTASAPKDAAPARVAPGRAVPTDPAPAVPKSAPAIMQCRRCSKRYRIPPELARGSIKCRECGEPLVAAATDTGQPARPAAAPKAAAPASAAPSSAGSGASPGARTPAFARLAAISRPGQAAPANAPTRPAAAALPRAVAAASQSPVQSAGKPAADTEELPTLELIADDLPAIAPAAAAPSAAFPPMKHSAAGARQASNRRRPKKPKATPIPRKLVIWAAGAVGICFLLALIVTAIFPAAGFTLFFGFIAVGWLVAFAAGLWLITLAFSEDATCGLMYLFVPFYGLYYIITRWPATKTPFLLGMSGTACILPALIIAGVGSLALVDAGNVPGQATGSFAPGAQPIPATLTSQGSSLGTAPTQAAPAPPGLMAESQPPDNPTAPFDLGNITLPQFSDRGPPQSPLPGVEWYEITVLRADEAMPAEFDRKIWLYLPAGHHPNQSLACVMIAPAGSTMMTGVPLTDGSQPEHLPYALAGFAVLAYELSGPVASTEATDGEYVRSYHAFRTSCAGLVDAHTALEYVLAEVPEIDPGRVYAAGHSSAGAHALLLACHEPRIRGCAAFAPVIDVEAWLQPLATDRVFTQVFTGLENFSVRSSPQTHAARLNRPLLLFHAQDDSVVGVQSSMDFANRLIAQGKKVELVVTPTGDHYDSMIQIGIPRAIEWFKKLELTGSAQPAAGAP